MSEREEQCGTYGVSHFHDTFGWGWFFSPDAIDSLLADRTPAPQQVSGTTVAKVLAWIDHTIASPMYNPMYGPTTSDYGEGVVETLKAVRNLLVKGAPHLPESQQVSTVEELDALPITSVVRGADGDVFELMCVKFSDQGTDTRWRSPGWEGVFTSPDIALPATVLYRPEGGDQ